MNSSFQTQVAKENFRSNMLLNSKTYPLNKSHTKYVAIGLSLDKPFKVVVKVYSLGAHQGVTFSEGEWQSFCSQEDSFHINFPTADSSAELWSFQKRFSFIKIGSNNILKVWDSVTDDVVFLGKKTCFELFNLKLLINLYIEDLLCLDFSKHYTGMLGYVKSHNEKIVRADDLLPILQRNKIMLPSGAYYTFVELIWCYPEIISSNFCKIA